MSHYHLCDVTGHFWECEGKAIRPGETEPSLCMCLEHQVPMNQGDHSRCRVELLACPCHLEEQLRRMDGAKQAFDKRVAEFGLDEKWVRMQAMPESPEKDVLAAEILNWILAAHADVRAPARFNLGQLVAPQGALVALEESGGDEEPRPRRRAVRYGAEERVGNNPPSLRG